MAHRADLVVTIPGQRRVDVQVGGHVVHTDQPLDNGGEDTGPSPYDLFLASIGACAGIFIQGFCSKRGISTEGISVVERPTFGDDGVLQSVALEIRVPPGFPDKYHAALINVVDGCSVKKAINAKPTFDVRVNAAQ